MEPYFCEIVNYIEELNSIRYTKSVKESDITDKIEKLFILMKIHRAWLPDYTSEEYKAYVNSCEGKKPCSFSKCRRLQGSYHPETNEFLDGDKQKYIHISFYLKYSDRCEDALYLQTEFMRLWTKIQSYFKKYSSKKQFYYSREFILNYNF